MEITIRKTEEVKVDIQLPYFCTGEYSSYIVHDEKKVTCVTHGSSGFGIAITNYGPIDSIFDTERYKPCSKEEFTVKYTETMEQLKNTNI